MLTFVLSSRCAEDARSFIDTAKATGLKHLGLFAQSPSLEACQVGTDCSRLTCAPVFASVGAADKDTDVPHFDSKMRIEEHLAASGLDYTVLRPTGFMENFEKDTKSLAFWATALAGQSCQCA